MYFSARWWPPWGFACGLRNGPGAKAPANIFMIPGIIPLLPGGALYYTMSALIGGDMDTVMLKGKETGLMALGIVVGILVASELVRMILWAEIRRKKMLRSRRTPPGPR